MILARIQVTVRLPQDEYQLSYFRLPTLILNNDASGGGCSNGHNFGVHGLSVRVTVTMQDRRHGL